MQVKLEHDDGPGSAIASFDERGLMVVATWSRKAEGSGEDAPPTFALYRPSWRALLAVYDGLGGSGSATYPPLVDGTVLSEAHVASRATKAALEEWFENLVTGTTDDNPQTISGRIKDNLHSVRNPRRSRVRGRLKRELPTTIASAEIEPQGSTTTKIVARWAGDSRVYLLTFVDGLQQITRDDTAMSDALEILTQNPPMSNVVALDRAFRINVHRLSVPTPTIVICATDGYFGYVETPALFEYVLLDTMAQATSMRDWGSRLRTAVLGYTQDDASVAIAVCGYPSFAELREAFADRVVHLRDEHWRPYLALRERDTDPLDETDAVLSHREAVSRFRLTSWSSYREGYSARIPPREEASR